MSNITIGHKLSVNANNDQIEIQNSGQNLNTLAVQVDQGFEIWTF